MRTTSRSITGGQKDCRGGRGDPFIVDRKPSQKKKLVTLNSGAFVPSLFHAEHDQGSYFREGEKIRGIVTTASYEARAFGVKTGMTMKFKLPVSIRASPAKWIAKLATGTAKPYGTRVVRQEEIQDFVKDIAIDEFPGVGRAFFKKMQKYGIKTIGQDGILPISLNRGDGKEEIFMPNRRAMIMRVYKHPVVVKG